jgi:hypothetical protein
MRGLFCAKMRSCLPRPPLPKVEAGGVEGKSWNVVVDFIFYFPFFAFWICRMGMAA